MSTDDRMAPSDDAEGAVVAGETSLAALRGILAQHARETDAPGPAGVDTLLADLERALQIRDAARRSAFVAGAEWAFGAVRFGGGASFANGVHRPAMVEALTRWPLPDPRR